MFEGEIYKRTFGPLHHRKRTKKTKRMKLTNIPFRVQYSDYREYAEEYLDFVRKEGADAYGFYTNPNTEFDWFQIGGRWSDKFLVKADFRDIFSGDLSFSLEMNLQRQPLTGTVGAQEHEKRHSMGCYEGTVPSERA